MPSQRPKAQPKSCPSLPAPDHLPSHRTTPAAPHHHPQTQEEASAFSLSPNSLSALLGRRHSGGKTPFHGFLPVSGGAHQGSVAPCSGPWKSGRKQDLDCLGREASAPDVGPAHRPRDHISSVPTSPSQTRASRGPVRMPVDTATLLAQAGLDPLCINKPSLNYLN